MSVFHTIALGYRVLRLAVPSRNRHSGAWWFWTVATLFFALAWYGVLAQVCRLLAQSPQPWLAVWTVVWPATIVVCQSRKHVLQDG